MSAVTIETNAQYHADTARLSNSMANRKPLFGVGVNDANYVTRPTINGKQVVCHFYQTWTSMLARCYHAATQDRQPTYIGCKVHGNWHKFMTFKAWMQNQDWQGKELDKDIIGNGKLYSAENCVFVSRSLNCFMNNSVASRGLYPLGVCKGSSNCKDLFKAYVRINSKKKHLGYFTDTEQAHAAWVIAKTKLAADYIASERDPRIIESILRYIKSLSKETEAGAKQS